MSGHKPFSILRREIDKDPERRRRVNEMKRAYEDAERLMVLRKQRNLTQQDVADALNVSQANVSRIEHEDDVYLSTLRAYIEALGGELEITARFPDGEVLRVG
jgi:DNA-directed RNA polymerase specialized sigma subunit